MYGNLNLFGTHNGQMLLTVSFKIFNYFLGLVLTISAILYCSDGRERERGKCKSSKKEYLYSC